MRNVTLAATQMACSWDREVNIANAERLVRQAAEAGAEVILLQELFETPYFCIEQRGEHLELAKPLADSALVKHFQQLARSLGVVLPISWFERAGNTFFNSLAMVDADGEILGVYRKSHIPNSVGYQEKQYFTPGDTGFKVWDTRFGRVGVGVCWDQWFPEAARAMVLQGAEMLLYPTAIGSEPGIPDLDSRGHWCRTMQGHAAANMVPLIASNRIGHEVATVDASLNMDFYGNSFIADHTGALLNQADDANEAVLVASFDLDEVARYRTEWGVFRDRRPDLYGVLTTHGEG
ncbi:N-carbamoylputrescine amidase [Parahalioglobus pacificus]|uniref:N-carbamoylputrescine amidase n=1 Tax=Parahalioglobus pacificus TaxID=930806 RepID=A0A919CMI3_9GAMM|nr:N-carbamoylputrescine amidase [Halioglobus pacificus]GHD36038.1 N-carbamoylputrescine amidase [Halioglobus pacificus]